MSNLIAPCLLILMVGFSPAHAAKGPARRVAARCWHYFTSGTPFGTRASLVDRMVAVKGLPTGFKDLVSDKGLARVIAQNGDVLTIEYTNHRTMELETLDIAVSAVKKANKVEEMMYASELRKAAVLAERPDPELVGQTIRFEAAALGYARIVAATHSKIQVEVVDLNSFETHSLRVTRAEDLEHPSVRQANYFSNLIGILPALKKQADLRDGAYVSWTPGLTPNTQLMMESNYLAQQLFHDQILFNYEGAAFSLPDVPAVRVPHYYRQRGIPLRIERVALDQNVIYVSGANWSGALKLSVDLLTRSKFVADDEAKLFTLNLRGVEPFADFRARFNEHRLRPGDAVMEFEHQPEDAGLTAPVETANPRTYRVIYVDPDVVIVKNPQRTLHLRTPRDLARFATGSKSARVTAVDAYLAEHGDAELESDGSFVPTDRQVIKRPYLRELRSIRHDLRAAGHDASQIEEFARRVTEPVAGNQLGAGMDEAELLSLIKIWHPDRSEFATSPSARDFATDVVGLLGMARQKLKDGKAKRDLVHEDAPENAPRADDPGTGVALALPYRSPNK